MPRPRAGRGDKCLRDTLIFMERTSEKSCKITLPVILQLSLSSVIFLSYYGKWAHAPADRHRPILQPYSSSAAGEFSGKKRAGSIRSFAASLSMKVSSRNLMSSIKLRSLISASSIRKKRRSPFWHRQA